MLLDSTLPFNIKRTEDGQAQSYCQVKTGLLNSGIELKESLFKLPSVDPVHLYLLSIKPDQILSLLKLSFPDFASTLLLLTDNMLLLTFNNFSPFLLFFDLVLEDIDLVLVVILNVLNDQLFLDLMRRSDFFSYLGVSKFLCLLVPF
jgi:hypothetical protein